MSMSRTFRRREAPDPSRADRAMMGEALLLRFLVQHGLLAHGLLKAADIERRGAGSPLSLLDWLVCRGHISENALTFAMAHCLRLVPPAPPLSNTETGMASGPSAASARVDLEPGRARVVLHLVRGRGRPR